METIVARNVNQAWEMGKKLLRLEHVVRPSRVGEVWEYPTPVVTCYLKPTERVLFDPVRDANPYFHFFEGLWMLAGRNDIKWLSQFNKRMLSFSDNGETQHGAYGFRWRRHFLLNGASEKASSAYDQLPLIVEMFKRSPDERRAVLTMWDPTVDLNQPGLRDVPCNDIVMFKIREGALTITVCCRSNDIIWGLFGANCCHMSMLQEYVAAQIGVPVGPMYTLSDSFHAYTERWELYGCNTASFLQAHDLYSYEPGSLKGPIAPYPMVAVPELWDAELRRWFHEADEPELDSENYQNPLFPYVAQPIYNSWLHYKAGDLERAAAVVKYCWAEDWRTACMQWVERRIERRAAKAANLASH